MISWILSLLLKGRQTWVVLDVKGNVVVGCFLNYDEAHQELWKRQNECSKRIYALRVTSFR